MVFSSLHFLLVFLPAFLGVYYATPPRFRNYSALAASLFFYAWGAPRLVFYLAASCFLDYGASQLLACCHDRAVARKRIAAAAICLNVGLLAYFKYANFFVHEINRAFSFFGIHTLQWTDVALPIGISFFTFHRVSYIVDVYRQTTPPAKSYTDYLLYILLFPQLIAGPIVRYHEVAEEITARKHSLALFCEGISRFSVGLAKKVLLANVLGEVADRVFAVPSQSLLTSYAWLGILSYTCQIYFDFSGYSDMAVGLARMMGIHFPENFNAPYISRSITEFWRRWHISLSSFMRDYLYIPLGGNRISTARTYANLWVVFLVSGLWHGANWTFILWGAYHGLFLVFDRIYWLKRLERLPAFVGVGATFLTVLLGWVLFRSADLTSAVHFVSRMFGLMERSTTGPPVPPWQRVAGYRAFFTLGLALAMSFLPALRNREPVPRLKPARPPLWSSPAVRWAGSIVLTYLSICYLSSGAFNPFIYFRF